MAMIQVTLRIASSTPETGMPYEVRAYMNTEDIVFFAQCQFEDAVVPGLTVVMLRNNTKWIIEERVDEFAQRLEALRGAVWSARPGPSLN